MEALLDRGGNESERMALEDKHNEERAQLDNSKSIADALRSSLGNVGSLRGLVSESTGGTSSLQDAWKRQEQAAFGHIKDPVADAVTFLIRKIVNTPFFCLSAVIKALRFKLFHMAAALVSRFWIFPKNPLPLKN